MEMESVSTPESERVSNEINETKRTEWVSCEWVWACAWNVNESEPCRCRCEVRCAEEVKNILLLNVLKASEQRIRFVRITVCYSFFSPILSFSNKSISPRFVQFWLKFLLYAAAAALPSSFVIFFFFFHFIRCFIHKITVYMRASQSNSWLAVLNFRSRCFVHLCYGFKKKIRTHCKMLCSVHVKDGTCNRFFFHTIFLLLVYAVIAGAVIVVVVFMLFVFYFLFR